MLHTKSRRNRSTGSEDEDFEGFLPYIHAKVYQLANMYSIALR